MQLSGIGVVAGLAAHASALAFAAMGRHRQHALAMVVAVVASVLAEPCLAGTLIALAGLRPLYIRQLNGWRHVLGRVLLVAGFAAACLTLYWEKPAPCPTEMAIAISVIAGTGVFAAVCAVAHRSWLGYDLLAAALVVSWMIPVRQAATLLASCEDWRPTVTYAVWALALLLAGSARLEARSLLSVFVARRGYRPTQRLAGPFSGGVWGGPGALCVQWGLLVWSREFTWLGAVASVVSSAGLVLVDLTP